MDTYQCNAPHDTLEFSTSDIPEYIRKNWRLLRL